MDTMTQANRHVWDCWTREQLTSDHHRDLATVRAGGSTLRGIERAAIGDVRGKTLLHLQCNMGADTLSWARLGARVTGVDFSDEAIRMARHTADDLGLLARFITAEVLGLPATLDERFDLVVSTYGTICFLPDVTAWAGVVAHLLRPGGVLLLIEMHPVTALITQKEGDAVRIAQPSTDPSGPRVAMVDTSAGHEAPLYTWSHPIGQVVTALASAGLRLTALGEHPYTFWQQFPSLRQSEDGWWHWPTDAAEIPLLYSVLATR